jgi:hypothetical protein
MKKGLSLNPPLNEDTRLQDVHIQGMGVLELHCQGGEERAYYLTLQADTKTVVFAATEEMYKSLFSE